MNTLTLIVFISITIIAYFAGHRNLVAPWFLMCLAFLAAYIIVLLNLKNWDVQMNGKFLLYVCTALFSFGLSSIFFRVKVPENAKTVTDVKSIIVERERSKYPVNALLVLSFICSMGYVYRLLTSVPSDLSFGAKIKAVYNNVVANDYTPGIIFNQMLEITFAIGYLNLYRLYIKIFTPGDKVSAIKLVIPIVLFLFTAMVSSDRNIFIRFAFYTIVLWALFYMSVCRNKKVNLRIAAIAVVMLGLAAGVFFALGAAKQYNSSFFKQISNYAGSGVYDFNLWIADYKGEKLYGQATFLNMIDSLGTILKPFGIELDGVMSRFDEFISFTSTSGYKYNSNIYTDFKPYVEDFGYFGVILFPFIKGVIFHWLFKKVTTKKIGGFWLIYCMLIYGVIFSPILEQFFRRFHMGFIYEFFWLAFLYLVCFKRKSYGRVKKSVNEIMELRKLTAGRNYE